MLLKPAPGRAVRVPGSMRLLSKAGEDITLTAFWHRLLRAGDVVEAKEPLPLPTSKKLPLSAEEKL